MTEQHSSSVSSKWSTLFWVAFGYNLFGASGPLLQPELFLKLFFVAPPQSMSVVSQVHLQLGWVSVLSFGIGYAFVALDPTKNRGIVWLGMAGKMYVGLLFVLFWSKGHLQLAAMLGGLGDILFAFLFLLFLWQTRAMANVAPKLLV